MDLLTEAAKQKNSTKYFAARVQLEALYPLMYRNEDAIGVYCFRPKPS
jgi:hypothetical protein